MSKITFFGVSAPSGLFGGLRAMTVQSYTEANVKLGQQFGISVELEIPLGETKYITFKTPVSDSISIKTRLISTNGGMRYQPRVGAVFVDDGATRQIVNFSGQSSNTSNAVARDTPSVITDMGLPFDVVRSSNGLGNQDEQGIFAGDGIERVLDKDTTYLLEFENLDNNAIYIIYGVTWYEGVLDLPL